MAGQPRAIADVVEQANVHPEPAEQRVGMVRDSRGGEDGEGPLGIVAGELQEEAKRGKRRIHRSPFLPLLRNPARKDDRRLPLELFTRTRRGLVFSWFTVSA